MRSMETLYFYYIDEKYGDPILYYMDEKYGDPILLLYEKYGDPILL